VSAARRCAAFALLGLVGCRAENTGSGGSSSVAGNARIAFPRTGPAHEWPMPGADYSNSRFSELAQITPANAKNLRAAWTFSTGVLRGHEGQPLVVNHTMYVVTPYPNVAYALDLTVPGSPLKWKFRPENDQASQGLACCDVVNRGAA
jgi:glucose dehydrogenase